MILAVLSAGPLGFTKIHRNEDADTIVFIWMSSYMDADVVVFAADLVFLLALASPFSNPCISGVKMSFAKRMLFLCVALADFLKPVLGAADHAYLSLVG